MEELPQKGSKYTWCNNRAVGTVQEKIDRCVANWEWRKIFPKVVSSLAPITSDHSPLTITSSPSDHQKKHFFRFEPYWTEHEDFNTIIEQSWKQGEASIESNLNSVVTNLQSWSRNTFKRAYFKIKKLKHRLEKIHRLPPTKENMEMRFKLKKTGERLVEPRRNVLGCKHED